MTDGRKRADLGCYLSVLLEKRDHLLRRVIGVHVSPVVDDKLNRRIGGVDPPGGFHCAFPGLEVHNQVVPAGDMKDRARLGLIQ
jgi:hypothetical protein